MAYQTTMLKFSQLTTYMQQYTYFLWSREPDSHTMNNELSDCTKKNWESVYTDKDPNCMFNSLLCTFLKISQASFPV